MTAFVVAIVVGCCVDDAGREREPMTGEPAKATRKARCDIGGRPDYFVPGDGGRIAIIGCARLGASGKPVEFSVERERIGRNGHICINPAYRGRGQLGIYIPTVCVPDPVSRRLNVISTEIPAQGVRDYGLVIWGTAGASIRTVHAGYHGAETRAAVFPVRPALARAVGTTRPFSVFVVELVPKPACAHVRARTPNGYIAKVAEYRPGLCPSS